MVLALTSDVLDRGQMYDAASSILIQRLSQISGVGQVIAGGGALPGVRVEVNPTQLNSYGLGLQNVATLLNQQNANLAKGQIADDFTSADISANDQLLKAADYKPLVVGYSNGAAIKLSTLRMWWTPWKMSGQPAFQWQAERLRDHLQTASGEYY